VQGQVEVGARPLRVAVVQALDWGLHLACLRLRLPVPQHPGVVAPKAVQCPCPPLPPLQPSPPLVPRLRLPRLGPGESKVGRPRLHPPWVGAHTRSLPRVVLALVVRVPVGLPAAPLPLPLPLPLLPSWLVRLCRDLPLGLLRPMGRAPGHHQVAPVPPLVLVLVEVEVEVVWVDVLGRGLGLQAAASPLASCSRHRSP
jgi:hypothetical protein